MYQVYCSFLQALFQHMIFVLDHDFADECASGIDVLLQAFNTQMHDGPQNEPRSGYREAFYSSVLAYMQEILCVSH